MGITTTSRSRRRTDSDGRVGRRRRSNPDRLTAEQAVTELTVENSDAYVLHLCSQPYQSTGLHERLIAELTTAKQHYRLGSLGE